MWEWTSWLDKGAARGGQVRGCIGKMGSGV